MDKKEAVEEADKLTIGAAEETTEMQEENLSTTVETTEEKKEGKAKNNMRILKTMIKKRKVPMRVCIGCQEKKPKKELVRIVRTPNGEVMLDSTGKKAGRGAYICPQEVCLNKAIKARRLERNLQTKISDQLVKEITVTLKNYHEE